MTGEYWVFKYVDDIARQEPRNVGVLLRTEDTIHARFLGEKDADGPLDLRTVRGVVRHTGAYKQWVDYWRYCIRHAGTTAQVVDMLLASGRGNYIVSGASPVAFPDIRPAEALTQLFYSLVTEFPAERVEEASLASRVDEIISEYRLRESPFFQETPAVECTLEDGVVEHVRPSYAWINGHEVYFQKVSISAARLEPTQKDVHNAAWIFEKLRQSRPRAERKTLAKVIGSDEDNRHLRAQTQEYLALLERLSTSVIDVDNEVAVQHAFAPLAVH